MKSPDVVAPEEFVQLRDELQDRLREGRLDPLAAASSNGLKFMFNCVAPTDLRLDAESGALHLRSGVPRLTARQVSHVTHALSQAVAALTRDSTESSQMSQLTSADYRRAPIYVQAQAGNLLVFHPDRAEHIGPLNANVEMPTSRALARLTDLLPESRDESNRSVARAAIGAGPRDRFALAKVADVAREVEGVSLDWDAQTGSSHAELSNEQAQELRDVLREVRVTERKVTVRGLLDGTRVGRRRFWLNEDDGRGIDGIVEEEAMPNVLRLINRHVVAEVLELRQTGLSGRQSRPTYRLLSVSEDSRPLNPGR